MRFTFFLFCILLISTQANALPAALEQGQVLRGEFTQLRYLKGFKKPLKSEGGFIVAPQKGVIWSVKKPFPMMTLVAPNKLLQTNDGRKVMELTGAKAPFVRSLYQMIGGALAGQWKMLEKDFLIEKKVNGTSWSVTLNPVLIEGSFLPFTKIQVNGQKAVEKVVLNKSAGDRDVLTFTNVYVKRGALTKSEQALFNAEGQ